MNSYINTTLSELCRYYGINQDDTPYNELDADTPVSIWRDGEGEWHVSCREAEFADERWAPRNDFDAVELAASLPDTYAVLAEQVDDDTGAVRRYWFSTDKPPVPGSSRRGCKSVSPLVGATTRFVCFQPLTDQPIIF